MAKREFCERIVVTEKKREGRLSDSLPEYNFSGEYFIEEKLYNGKHWFSRKQSISDGNPAKGCIYYHKGVWKLTLRNLYIHSRPTMNYRFLTQFGQEENLYPPLGEWSSARSDSDAKHFFESSTLVLELKDETVVKPAKVGG